MKIFKKRFFASLIDSFVHVSFMVACQTLLEKCIFEKYFFEIWSHYFEFYVLLIPFFFKDLSFKNASLGKKIVGIVIVDEKWQAPQRKIIVKRAIMMSTVGFCLAWKCKFIDGTPIDLFDWEREKLKTQVIDRKVFKRIKEEANRENGDTVAAMTKLYDDYLRTLYIK